MIWKSSAFAPYERAILTGLLAGYFFYLVFTFDNLTSYILFIAILAYITVRAHGDQPERGAPQADAHVLPWAALGGTVLSLTAVWFVNADAITQNRAIIQGISPQQGGITKNLEFFKDATTYRSVGDQEVREQFSQAAISVINIPEAPVEIKQEFVKSAYEAMDALSKEAPLSARFPFFMGILLDQAGLYDDANKALLRAHENSPRKQSILFELGLNSFARGKNDEALAYFKEAYEYAPEYPDARTHYIAALIRAGKDAEAEALLQPFVEAGTAVDPRIASAYAARNQYGKIVAIWTAHVQKNPTQIEPRFVLAGAQFSNGDPAGAIATLEAIKREFPGSAQQAEQLIQQVKSGKK